MKMEGDLFQAGEGVRDAREAVRRQVQLREVLHLVHNLL